MSLNGYINTSIIFTIGMVFGAIISFFANYADIIALDKTITNLEQKAKSLPVVTIDALGICSVAQGGKSYMLIDVTNELRGIEQVDDAYRATEQEIEKEENHKKEAKKE